MGGDQGGAEMGGWMGGDFRHTWGGDGGAFAAPMELFVAKKHDFLGGESV